MATAVALVMCVSLLWVAGPAPAFAQGVTQRFAKAQKLFDQGQIKPAYKQLVAIAKKYPDHQPTRLLLGRVFFRTGQVSRAAAQFKRVSPDMLSGDAAYEYGMAFYQIKDYRRANAGLSRVPSNSKFYDLANFYRGLSYYQTREYAKAQLYLTRAKKLPKNLVHTKREALTSLRRLLRNERHGGSQPTNPYVIVPTPPPPAYMYPSAPPVDVGPPANATTPAKPATPAPAAAPTSGFVNVITPSFTWKQVAANIDYFGTKTDSTESNTSTVKVAFKTQYNAEPRDNGGQPYGSLAVDLVQDEVSSRNSSVEYKVYTDRPGEIIESETETPLTSSKSTTVAATPEFGFPATEAIDLKAGLKYSSLSSKGSKTDDTGPYGSFDWAGETVTLKLSGSQTNSVTTTTEKVTKTTTVMAADIGKRFDTAEIGLLVQQSERAFQRAAPLPAGPANGTTDATTMTITADATKTWESFSMTFAATQKTIENPFPQVYIFIGEQQSLKLELSGLKTFDFGGSFSLAAASEQLSNYQEVVPDPKGATGEDGKTVIQVPAKGSGTRTTLTATLKLTPFDWLFGSISLKQTTLALSFSDQTLEPAIQRKTPEAILEQTIQAGVSKSF